MKTIAIRFTLFCAFVLLVLPRFLSAQAITINSVSGTSFCEGDSISVTFTASGNWSQNKNNAFTIQLSDAGGSFANTFNNLGSIKDTADGAFTLASMVPTGIPSSIHYRIRITGAYPYTASADNGLDIIIHKAPTIRITYSSSATPIVGMPIDLTLSSGDLADTTQHFKVTWNFGDGASPSSAVDSVFNNIDTFLYKRITYSFTGTKTVTVTISNGCSTTLTTQIVVYGCVYPSISHRTVVIDRDTDIANQYHGNAYWINPGVNVTFAGQGDTLYLESGASLTFPPGQGEGLVIYMKRGSSLNGGAGDLITYDSGASISQTLYSNRILCGGLNFDYTNAPPNKAFPQQGVVREDAALARIMIAPNPATSTIELQNIPGTIVNMDIINLLGETMMHIAPPLTDNFRINISQLQSGAYYLRIVSQDGVTTKKIVKE